MKIAEKTWNFANCSITCKFIHLKLFNLIFRVEIILKNFIGARELQLWMLESPLAKLWKIEKGPIIWVYELIQPNDRWISTVWLGYYIAILAVSSVHLLCLLMNVCVCTYKVRCGDIERNSEKFPICFDNNIPNKCVRVY